MVLRALYIRMSIKGFLSVLLELTYKYTAKRKGPWHETRPGLYGWYWWE